MRTYSTLSSLPTASKPIPIKFFDKLGDKDAIISYRPLLKNKGGVYSFINTVNNKQYIGSAKDLYLRLLEHISNKKSNSALQNALEKYGIDKFNFCIYEYFTYHSKIISHKALTDLETSYIQSFDFDSLYKFKQVATSNLGYKHTEETIKKMIKRFEDKHNHPMFGKTHKKETLVLISKPGILNPMYGKLHTELTSFLQN